jgi:hypothetical protein
MMCLAILFSWSSHLPVITQNLLRQVLSTVKIYSPSPAHHNFWNKVSDELSADQHCKHVSIRRLYKSMSSLQLLQMADGKPVS